MNVLLSDFPYAEMTSLDVIICTNYSEIRR
jgi:hypothetical protein